jgi:hypothetical protein
MSEAQQKSLALGPHPFDALWQTEGLTVEAGAKPARPLTIGVRSFSVGRQQPSCVCHSKAGAVRTCRVSRVPLQLSTIRREE